MLRKISAVLSIIAACGIMFASVFATPALATGYKQVTIVNESTYWAARVYIVPAGSDSWGPDLMASDETILPGYQKTWNVNWSGVCYVDVRVISLLGAVSSVSNLYICGGGGGTYTLYDGR